MVQARSDVASAPAEAQGPRAEAHRGSRLDLQEGFVPPPGEQEVKCARWPEHYRLFNGHTGELVRGRCCATNLCLYCRVLGVIETAEMWKLDAAEYAPTLLAVLTAREHLTRAQLRKELDHLRRAAKKRWSVIEWAVSIEFQRRGALHANLLIKGVPTDARDELRSLWFGDELERGIWTRRVDAEHQAQYLGELASHDGAIAYLNQQLVHGLKQEQAPPLGWRGHRTSQTRGYLVRPASVMREEARDSLRRKRTLHKLVEVGHPADLIELLMADAEAEHEAAEWRLRALTPEQLAPGTRAPRGEGIPQLATVRAVPSLADVAPSDRGQVARSWLEGGQSHPPGRMQPSEGS